MRGAKIAESSNGNRGADSRFFDGASDYVPIFDSSDTWESLRERSPFTITALIMVGAKIEDAGKEPSEFQQKCKEHAENMGGSSSSAKRREG